MTEHDITFIRHLPLQICQAYTRLGGDPGEALRVVGLKPEQLRQVHFRIHHEQSREMLNFCKESLGREDFGLHVGSTIDPLSFSSLGMSWLMSDTPLMGLQRLVRFTELLATGAQTRLEHKDDRYIIHLGGDAAAYTTYEEIDLVAGSVVRMVQLTISNDTVPTRVELRRAKPTDPAPWYAVFGNRVIFDAPKTAIHWQRDVLETERLAANEELARANDIQTEAVIRTLHESDFIQRVNSQIALHLPDGAPDQEVIARALAMSTRTLQRRLKEEGTSFSELVAELRKNLAVDMLRRGTRSIAEVAYQLGYAEHSTFSRAFKHWMGMSPHDFVESIETNA